MSGTPGEHAQATSAKRGRLLLDGKGMLTAGMGSDLYLRLPLMMNSRGGCDSGDQAKVPLPGHHQPQLSRLRLREGQWRRLQLCVGLRGMT